MTRYAKSILAAALVLLPGTFAGALANTICKHPDQPNHTYSVAGKIGAYTWDDHGIKRVRPLTCSKQQDGTVACHRWEHYGQNGKSIMIYRMLSDGTLIETGSWALLDISMVRVFPGFVCETN